MEFRLTEAGINKMPNNLFSEPRFFLCVSYEFITKRIVKFNKLIEKEEKQRKEAHEAELVKAQQEFDEQDSDEETEKIPMRTVELEQFYFPTMTKVYEPETRITESIALKNFQKNREEYDATKGSEYLNLEFDRDTYMKLLEYHAIYEFNTLRDKTFVPLNQFLDALRLVKPSSTPSEDAKQAAFPVEQMCARLKRSQSGLISVILVSGIPGSGKGRFAASLARMLKQERVRAEPFKMPTVQGSVRYSTDAFVSELINAAAN